MEDKTHLPLHIKFFAIFSRESITLQNSPYKLQMKSVAQLYFSDLQHREPGLRLS